MLNQS